MPGQATDLACPAILKRIERHAARGVVDSPHGGTTHPGARSCRCCAALLSSGESEYSSRGAGKLSFPLFGQAGAATRDLAHRYGVGTMAITRLLRGRSVSRFVTRASRTCGNRTLVTSLGDLRDVIRPLTPP